MSALRYASSPVGGMAGTTSAIPHYDYKTFISEKHAVSINDHYTFLDDGLIGEGGYGSIFLARSKLNPGRTVAIKKVSKKKVMADQLDTFKREVSLMRSLDHPAICRLLEVFEDLANFYLVLEYCEGGELFQRIVEEKHLSERTAAAIIKQVASALLYCHQRGIAHRDMKPENIVFLTKAPESPIKIIDFGFGTKFRPVLRQQVVPHPFRQVRHNGRHRAKSGSSDECGGEDGDTEEAGEGGDSDDSGRMPPALMKTRIGSLMYVAPEVLAGYPYDEKCDMWSLGVVLFVMLSGQPPFFGQGVVQKILNGDYSMTHGVWRQISPEARQLVSKLLVVDPKKRYTAEEVLKHPWVAYHQGAHHASIPAELLTNLRRYCRVNQFRRMAVAAVARQLDDNHIGHLHDVFVELDTNGDGVLSLQEMKQGFQKLCDRGLLTNEDIEEWFQDMDLDNSGFIDYTEFIAASIDKRQACQRDVCWSAFRVFDREGKGKISVQQLADVLLDADVQGLFGDEFCQQMLNYFDRNHDGFIDFQDFMTIMSSYGPRRSRSGVEIRGFQLAELDEDEMMDDEEQAVGGKQRVGGVCVVHPPAEGDADTDFLGGYRPANATESPSSLTPQAPPCGRPRGSSAIPPITVTHHSQTPSPQVSRLTQTAACIVWGWV